MVDMATGGAAARKRRTSTRMGAGGGRRKTRRAALFGFEGVPKELQKRPGRLGPNLGRRKTRTAGRRSILHAEPTGCPAGGPISDSDTGQTRRGAGGASPPRRCRRPRAAGANRWLGQPGQVDGHACPGQIGALVRVKYGDRLSESIAEIDRRNTRGPKQARRRGTTTRPLDSRPFLHHQPHLAAH